MLCSELYGRLVQVSVKRSVLIQLMNELNTLTRVFQWVTNARSHCVFAGVTLIFAQMHKIFLVSRSIR